jgi:hypothetical protein
VKTSLIIRSLCSLESFLGRIGMGNGLSLQDESKSLPSHPFHNDYCYLSSVWSLVRLVSIGKLVAFTLTCFSLKGCLCQFADGCI